MEWLSVNTWKENKFDNAIYLFKRIILNLFIIVFILKNVFGWRTYTIGLEYFLTFCSFFFALRE